MAHSKVSYPFNYFFEKTAAAHSGDSDSDDPSPHLPADEDDTRPPADEEDTRPPANEEGKGNS